MKLSRPSPQRSVTIAVALSRGGPKCSVLPVVDVELEVIAVGELLQELEVALLVLLDLRVLLLGRLDVGVEVVAARELAAPTSLSRAFVQLCERLAERQRETWS